MNRTIREFNPTDIDHMIRYFHNADDADLLRMGVDRQKLPSVKEWRRIVSENLKKPYKERSFYYLAWISNGVTVGHSNINKITFGEEAFMHLHLWQPSMRKEGNGFFLLGKSISRYFEQFKLKRILCEPCADNPAPNAILPKMGFNFVRSYETTPGWINFHQRVNRWLLTRETWKQRASL